MRLVDGHVLRAPVHLARRRLDEQVDAGLLRRTQHVERPDDVRLDIGRRCLVRPGDRDQSCKVEDDVRARSGGDGCVAVANVAENDLHVGSHRRLVEPSPRTEGVVLDEPAHVRAQLDEPFAQVASDEAAGARHEHAPSRPLAHSRSTSFSACS